MRVIDQVKAYGPGRLVTADHVRALVGVLEMDKASKGFPYHNLGLRSEAAGGRAVEGLHARQTRTHQREGAACSTEL